MRLIDADALLNRMQKDPLFDLVERYGVSGVINAEPTVDAVPVVHAQWVTSHDGMLHCSNCFETPTNRVMIRAELIYDMTPIRETMHYCPKCGAKMDARKEDKD